MTNAEKQIRRDLGKWNALRFRITTIANSLSINDQELQAWLKAYTDELESRLSELQSLSNGDFKLLASAYQLPHTLVAARIASGLTQSDLAKKVGVKPQQIYRYEKTTYAKIGLSKAIEIATVLHSALGGLHTRSQDG